jgi:tetratricopeptide (TPR) repeat protein
VPPGSPERDELVLYAGRALLGVGETPRAVELLEPLSRALGPRSTEALAFYALCLSRLGRHEQALSELEVAVQRATEQGVPRVEAVCLSSLAFVLQRADRGDDARAAYERAIDASERASDAGSLAVARANLAGLLKIRGDIAGAIEQYEAALDMGRRSGRRQSARQALLNLANLDLYLGRLARAETRIDAHEEQGDHHHTEMGAQLSGLRDEIHARNGQVDESVRHYHA